MKDNVRVGDTLTRLKENTPREIFEAFPSSLVLLYDSCYLIPLLLDVLSHIDFLGKFKICPAAFPLFLIYIETTKNVISRKHEFLSRKKMSNRTGKLLFFFFLLEITLHKIRGEPIFLWMMACI